MMLLNSWKEERGGMEEGEVDLLTTPTEKEDLETLETVGFFGFFGCGLSSQTFFQRNNLHVTFTFLYFSLYFTLVSFFSFPSL